MSEKANHESRITNYELRITNYELHFAGHISVAPYCR